MAEQIKKGWLYTREDEKFAPNTLVENVYTRSGTPYDEQVRNYFEAVRRANATTEGETAVKLNEHDSKLNSLQSQVNDTNTIINEHLEHFNDEGEGVLYITDEAGHIIAYFDATGIHTVDVQIKSGMTVSQVENDVSVLQADMTQANRQIEIIKNSLVNIDASDRDTLYICDKTEECNVIAYIDARGVHAVNFLTDSTVDYITLVNSVADNTDAIVKLEKKHDDAAVELWKTIEENKSRLDTLDKYFKYDQDSSEFFLVDNEDRVIFYVDETGAHTVNVYVKNARDYLTLDKALSDAETNIGILQEEDDKIRERLGKEESTSAEHNTRLTKLETKTQYLDIANDNALFIVDNNDNVVGYFDELGLHAINMWVGSDMEPTKGVYNVHSQITDLNSTLSTEIDRSLKLDAEHSDRLNTIEGRLNNVSNVMDFVGVYQTIQERDTKNPKPNNGDVCVVKDASNDGYNHYDKEYVYADGAWQEIGDVSAEMVRLDKLESIVGDPATNAKGTHEARLDGLDTALAQEVSDRKADVSDINTTLDNIRNNFSWTDDNRSLYIVDSSGNILALFYESGLVIHDVIVRDTKTDRDKNLRNSASYLAPAIEELTITWL